MVYLETFVLFVTLLAICYWYVSRLYTYWKRHGIAYIEPSIPFGNLQGRVQKYSFADLMANFYRTLKNQGPFGGLYILHQPVVLVTDPKLIKNILIKDFNHFMERNIFYNAKDDPLSAHLFSLDAPEWKELRSSLTPTFTSGRMKFMYPTIVSIADKFKETISASILKSDVIEVKDILGRFSTDVIGTCAFGIECNSLENPDSLFLEMGRKIFLPIKGRLKRQVVTNISRKFARLIGMRTTPDDVSEFFQRIVAETVEYREKNQLRRNDFMDLLIQMKNEKILDENQSGKSSNGLTMNQIAAQSFVFFIAGFETSSTLLTFTLYELAVNPDIQKRARKQILETLERYDGKFTYEAMLDMPYVDQVLNEALRKYPPLAVLMRSTTKPYRIPNTNFTLPIGMRVWLPIKGIQDDPEYYPNPEKFDPDRFTPDAVAARDPMTFLPFGDGPRNCIGLRFGLMQARIGLVTILQNFEILPSDKTTIPVVLDPKGFILTPLGGMLLKVVPLEKP